MFPPCFHNEVLCKDCYDNLSDMKAFLLLSEKLEFLKERTYDFTQSKEDRKKWESKYITVLEEASVHLKSFNNRHLKLLSEEERLKLAQKTRNDMAEDGIEHTLDEITQDWEIND